MKTQSPTLGAANPSQFSSLYNTYYPILFNYGMSMVQDEELIIDTVQELFMYLWEKRTPLAKVTYVKAYILQAFRRRLFKKMHKVRNYERLMWKLSEHVKMEKPEIDSGEYKLLKQESESERSNYVNQFLKSLSPRRRQVVELSYYEGLNHQEIADYLGIKYQTVLNHLQAVFNHN